MKRKIFMVLVVALALIATTLVAAVPVLASDGSPATASDAWNDFKSIADGGKLVALGGMLFAVLALGVINSLLNKDTRLRKVWDISRKRLIPGVVGYYAVCVMATLNSDMKSLALSSYAVFMGVLVGDVLANLKELGVPFPLPEWLTEFLTGSGSGETEGSSDS